MTASPFVLDLYGMCFMVDDEEYHIQQSHLIHTNKLISSGNCGVSQLTEKAQGGNLHDLIKMARQKGDSMVPGDKLRIGYQVAAAVAHMHSFDGDDTPPLLLMTFVVTSF